MFFLQLIITFIMSDSATFGFIKILFFLNCYLELERRYYKNNVFLLSYLCIRNLILIPFWKYMTWKLENIISSCFSKNDTTYLRIFSCFNVFINCTSLSILFLLARYLFLFKTITFPMPLWTTCDIKKT